MQQGNKKEYRNAWLTDSAFLKQIQFEDNYYLESLCYHVNSFLKNTPVPVVVNKKLFEESGNMVFSVGDKHHSIKVSTEYAYHDFISLVESWLYQYYPSYTVEQETDVPYSDEEMITLIKNGADINDVIAMRKKELFSEHAVIEKIILKDDQFVLNKNGKRFIYMSGTIGNVVSLSSFKNTLYSIKSGVERKKFIDSNSRVLKDLSETKEIVIDYQGKQMLNFFKINHKVLSEFKSKEISSFVYKIGKFIVKFSSQSLMDDCLKTLR
jgi:hypothetical protein